MPRGILCAWGGLGPTPADIWGPSIDDDIDAMGENRELREKVVNFQTQLAEVQRILEQVLKIQNATQKLNNEEVQEHATHVAYLRSNKLPTVRTLILCLVDSK